MKKKPNNIIYAGTQAYGVYYSRDSGQSWAAASNGLPDLNNNINSLLYLTVNNAIYAGTRLGLFKSTDGGQNWQFLQSGMPNDIRETHSLLYVNGVIYAGMEQGLIYKSEDYGKSWDLSFNGTENSYVSTLIADKNGSLYAGTFKIHGVLSEGIVKSTDAGKSWQPKDRGLPLSPLITTLLFANGSIYLGLNSQTDALYQSVDSANTWHAISNEWLNGGYISSFAYANSFIYAGVLCKGVYKSTDAGQIWSPIAGIAENACIRSLLHANGAIYATYTILNSNEQGIYKITNGDQNVEIINNGLANYSQPSSLAYADNILYVGTMNGLYAVKIK